MMASNFHLPLYRSLIIKYFKKGRVSLQLDVQHWQHPSFNFKTDYLVCITTNVTVIVQMIITPTSSQKVTKSERILLYFTPHPINSTAACMYHSFRRYQIV